MPYPKSIRKPKTVLEKVFWETAKIIYKDINYPHNSNIMQGVVDQLKKIDGTFRLDVLDAENIWDKEYLEKTKAYLKQNETEKGTGNDNIVKTNKRSS